MQVPSSSFVKTPHTVREKLVEHTLALIRRRGVNGFSYRDLAELVGVKTSSIHYYFPSKDDLVLEAVKEYTLRVSERVRAIDASLPAIDQVRLYLAPLRACACGDEICLAGMMATETMSLPESVHGELREFYRAQELWLAGVFERARNEHGKSFPVPPSMLAQSVFGALQNGLVTARLFGTPERLDSAIALIEAAVSPVLETA